MDQSGGVVALEAYNAQPKRTNTPLLLQNASLIDKVTIVLRQAQLDKAMPLLIYQHSGLLSRFLSVAVLGSLRCGT